MNIEAIDSELERPFNLGGKRILITGARGGIGNAAAQVCAGQGAQVCLADIAPPAGLEPLVPYYQVDVSDRAAVDDLAARVGPVWAVIDTAGICPPDDWTHADWDASFDNVVNVNLRGAINLARAFMPDMIDAGGGRFAFCGSVSGRMGGVSCGPHYAATKGGLHALVRWLAQKGTKHNVLVNAVAPGSVDTPMAAANNIDGSIYPQRRSGRPKELGATLAFLCSPAAGFISGAIIDVNGGTYFG